MVLCREGVNCGSLYLMLIVAVMSSHPGRRSYMQASIPVKYGSGAVKQRLQGLLWCLWLAVTETSNVSKAGTYYLQASFGDEKIVVDVVDDEVQHRISAGDLYKTRRSIELVPTSSSHPCEPLVSALHRP
jgi:hypothetical protein